MTELTAAELELLARARLSAVRQRPYYAPILFALQPLATPGLGTVAVDRSARLYVDFEAFSQWAPEVRAGALVHEACHLLQEHHSRARRLGGELDAYRWNVAADAEINDGIDLPLPAGVVTPSTIGQQPGLLAEQYYRSLDSDNAPTERIDCGSCVDGVPRSWESPGSPGLSEPEINSIRRRVAAAIRDAPPGSVAAGESRWAKALDQPRVDWRVVLRQLLTGEGRGVGATHWTYAKPARRRALGAGFLVPTVYTPRQSVAIVVDTSASISQRQLDDAATELLGLCRALPAATVHVFSCDTAATYEGAFSRADMHFTGGGGTDLTVGIGAALELRPVPGAVIVATDGHTPWPPLPPARSRLIALLIGESAPAPPAWVRAVWLRSRPEDDQ